MLFELLHVMRRWPSVAAALSIHGLIVGMVLLVPAPRPPAADDGMTDLPIPIDLVPRPPSGRAAPAGGRVPPRDKDVAKRPRPEPQPTPELLAPADETPPEPATTVAELDGNAGESGFPGGELGDGDASRVGVPGGTGDDPAGGTGVVDGADPGPASSTPIRVTSRVDEPTLVKRVEPVYPAIARRTRTQGVVVLDCVIDERGRVEVRGILDSIPLLDSAAVAAVEQWRYEPARLAGRPQAVLLSVRVAFRLDQ